MMQMWFRCSMTACLLLNAARVVNGVQLGTAEFLHVSKTRRSSTAADDITPEQAAASKSSATNDTAEVSGLVDSADSLTSLDHAAVDGLSAVVNLLRKVAGRKAELATNATEVAEREQRAMAEAVKGMRASRENISNVTNVTNLAHSEVVDDLIHTHETKERLLKEADVAAEQAIKIGEVVQHEYDEKQAEMKEAVKVVMGLEQGFNRSIEEHRNASQATEEAVERAARLKGEERDARNMLEQTRVYLEAVALAGTIRKRSEAALPIAAAAHLAADQAFAAQKAAEQAYLAALQGISNTTADKNESATEATGATDAKDKFAI